MAKPLEYLAGRASERPFYLGSTLALFAESEQFDDSGLCRFLSCPVGTLPLLRLCRTPDEAPTDFRRDVQKIAERFGVNTDALAEAVRRGQALRRLRKTSGGTLLAARDAEGEPEP
jgi:hypothetical protein